MEDRIRELERAVSRWRLVCLGAVALAACAVVLAAGPWLTGEVRSNKFTLVNSRGEEVGALGFDEQDEPRLALKLARTKGTVLVGSLAGDIGGVGLVGEQSSASLAVDADGFPALSIRSDKRGATLAVTRQGEPTLLMLAEAGNVSATPTTIRFRKGGSDLLVLPDALGAGGSSGNAGTKR